MHGFVHVEIPTRDLRRAKAFYGKVFGWTFSDFDRGYTMFSPPGGGVGGGIYKVKAIPRKPGVQAYVEVANVEATLQQIKKARGKVRRAKMEVPGFGWWAEFADPQGAVLFLWQAAPGGRGT